MHETNGGQANLQTAVTIIRIRNIFVRGAIGMAAVGAVALFVYDRFAARADPAIFVPWFLMMAICPIGYALISLIHFLRQPGDAEVLRVWYPLNRAIRVLLDLTIIASVWVLLPLAEPDLLMVMIVLYVWFLATEIMVDGGLAGGRWLGTIGVSASLIVYLLLRQVPYHLVLAMFLGLTTATLIILGRVIDRTSNRLIAAQCEAERANAALQGSLVTIAAQRDDKTRFIAAASHDLLQPLQAAQLFFEHAITANAPTVRAQAIAGTRSALASTRNLVGHMLDYLRLEAGVVVARPEAVPLAPLLAALVAERTPAAQRAGMRLVLASTSHCVWADPVLLRRAVGNLIDNAVHHAGGTRALIGARRSAGRVTLWVIDDGVGVSAADVDRLFDDFAQGRDHGALTRGGFGLGLAVVRRSAAMMAGAAGIDTRWRHGAAFYLQLPEAERLAVGVEAALKAA